MIIPTVGRVVHFYPSSLDSEFSPDPQQPHAGIVAHVWSPRMINVTVFGKHSGEPAASLRTSVQLVQDGDHIIPDQAHAEWMPYQTGQAAKTERLQAELDAKFDDKQTQQHDRQQEYLKDRRDYSKQEPQK